MTKRSTIATASVVTALAATLIAWHLLKRRHAIAFSEAPGTPS